MTDWSNCPAVERKSGKISGAWAFTGTRVPVYALFENLAGGASIDEFVEWFPGVDKQQVRAVLEHEVRALREERRSPSDKGYRQGDRGGGCRGYSKCPFA